MSNKLLIGRVALHNCNKLHVRLKIFLLSTAVSEISREAYVEPTIYNHEMTRYFGDHRDTCKINFDVYRPCT